MEAKRKRANKWSCLQKEMLLTQLIPVISWKKSIYLDFVSLVGSQEFEKFYSRKNLPSMLGSSSIKEYIKEKFVSITNRIEIPKSGLATDFDKVISIICEWPG